jgi:hypothetical protein
MTDPVRRSITVPLPPDRARDLFTRGLPVWWPAGHGPAPDVTPGPSVTVNHPAGPAQVTFTPVDGGTRVEVEQTPANAPAAPQARAA